MSVSSLTSSATYLKLHSTIYWMVSSLILLLPSLIIQYTGWYTDQPDPFHFARVFLVHTSTMISW